MHRRVTKTLYPRYSPSIAKGVTIIRGCDIDDSLASEQQIGFQRMYA